MKTIFFQESKTTETVRDVTNFRHSFSRAWRFRTYVFTLTSFTIQKIMTFVSHLQIVGDVRQIFHSNNIELAAGKTKQNALLPVTAHGSTHLLPNILSCTNVAQFCAGLYDARQCTTA